jgi:hypothetical protein
MDGMATAQLTGLNLAANPGLQLCVQRGSCNGSCINSYGWSFLINSGEMYCLTINQGGTGIYDAQAQYRISMLCSINQLPGVPPAGPYGNPPPGSGQFPPYGPY